VTRQSRRPNAPARPCRCAPPLTAPEPPQARSLRLADLHAQAGPETLAAAAAYLRAFGAGDAATAGRMLACCTPEELVAGLTVLACVLADERGANAGTGTAAVLERTWRHAVAIHRTAIGLQ
jgi:hypothetical protein